MDKLTKALRTFGRFWYDFVVGDDPKIAVGVATVLVLGGVLSAAGMVGDGMIVVLAGLVMLAFTVSMAVDVSRSRNRS